MRYFVLAVLALVVFGSCKKDKYTTAPQITFKSITNTIYGGLTTASSIPPVLVIEVTDAEGDLGFSTKDTSYVFVKNISVAPYPMDSFKFPASLPQNKNFKGEVSINFSAQTGGVLTATCGTGCTDSLYFEVYVKDFAKNKSNVIKTETPLYFIHP